MVIGEPFARLITMEGGIKQTLDAAIERASGMGDEFQMIADSVETELLPAFAEAFKPGNVEKFVEILGALVPEILKIVGVIGKLAEIIEPILDGILAVMEKMAEFKDFVGDDNEDRETRLVGKEGETTFDSVKDVGKMTAAGAGVGALVGGPVGALAGAAVGLGAGVVFEVGQAVVHHGGNALDNETDIMGNPVGMPMAIGGVVNSPITALIGEAGPEAVIPLDRLPEMVSQINSTSSTSNTEQVINLTFDSINIGAGNNVSAGDIRQIIENEMPKIIRSSLTRGVRGVL